MMARKELKTALCVEVSIFATEETAVMIDSNDLKAPFDDSKFLKK